MLSDLVSILDGATFVVSDRLGDLDASLADSHGLFHSDTRYLSRFRLTVNEVSPKVLSVDDSAHYAAQFFLVQPTGSVIDDSQLAVIRRRSIDLGFREEITVLSHSRQAMDVDLQIDVAADFADLFEVKEHLDKVGTCYEDIRDGGLLLGYRRDGFRRETLITTSDQSCTLTPKSLRFAINLPPRGEWSVTVDVAVASDMLGDTRTRRRADSGFETVKARGAAALDAWRAHLPTVTSDWVPLVETYRQGVADLAALRLPVNAPLGPFVPAAGLPWFMCLFGRDSIITSYEALPFAPELAEATLRTLALMQARTIDDFRDAYRARSCTSLAGS